MTERYFPVRCPVCGWTGSSEEAECDCYGDDYSDPYCPNCFFNGEGPVVYLEDYLEQGEDDNN